MKTNTIRQTVTLPGTPADVYELLMSARKHAALTGSKVTMSRKINGKFTVFDGYCTGFNIELVEGKRIVQGWHFEEEGWPDDHFSVCTFAFKKVAGGTQLTFTQEGVPANTVAALKTGWKEFYWQPMEAYLVKKLAKK
jgi:activator of HSP90 ATPase